MTIRWYDRNIQRPPRPLVRLFERYRPVREEHALKQINSSCKPAGCRLTFLAQSSVENLAPVCKNRLDHTRTESWHARILSERRGTRSSLSSASVRVQRRAATSPPADVPVTTRGSRSASRKAFTTPKLFSMSGETELRGRKRLTDSTQTMRRRIDREHWSHSSC